MLTFRSICTFGALGFCFFVARGALAQQHVSIHITNGAILDAEVVKVGEGALTFRAGESAQAVELPYGQISAIVWPEPSEWIQARQFFNAGRFEEAALVYEKLATAKSDPRLGYPSPGNIATLAQRRLVECHRYRGDATAVANLLPAIEADRLPPAEREISPVLHAWAALGRGEWSRVIEIAEKAFAGGLSATSEEGVELAYLSGVAYRSEGRPDDALIAFGQANALGAGTDPRILRMAIIEALCTLEGDERPTRIRERRALAHQYAAMFGKGVLWEGAPPMAQAAAKEPLELGEAALGQSGRSGRKGDISKQTSGLKGAEQVTADHMKAVKEGNSAEATGGTPP